MSENRTKTKKVFSVILTILTVIIFAAAAFVMINVIVAKIKNRPVSLFGYSFANVLTDSMEPTIDVGDLVVFKLCDYSEVKAGQEDGDVIVFVAGDGFKALKGQNIIHRAIEKTESGIVTKGDNPKSLQDIDKVTADNLLGKCVNVVPGVGAFFSFLANYALLIVVALVGIPFIISQIVKIVKLSKEKQVAAAADGSASQEKDESQVSETPADSEDTGKGN